MNRRDFAKGLVLLPLVGTAHSFAELCSKKVCSPNGPYLLVILEGAFALVLGNHAPYSLTAFSPRHDGRHLLAVNGQVSSADAKYGFRLLPAGIADATGLPCVYPCYPGFYAEQTPCQQSRKDHFVTIDLPVPQAVFLASSRYKATMESDETFYIPSAKVLIYQLKKDVSAVEMFGSEGDDIVRVNPTKFLDFPAFRIEVGLPNLLGTDSDPDGSHAVDFYNNGLLPHFSALVGVKARRIKEIATYNPNLEETQLIGGVSFKKFEEHLFTTTTFECKLGGLTTTLP